MELCEKRFGLADDKGDGDYQKEDEHAEEDRECLRKAWEGQESNEKEKEKLSPITVWLPLHTWCV